MADESQTAQTTITILAIDAWRYDQGWTWNQWHRIGACDVAICDLKPRALLAWLRDHGFLGSGSRGKVAIEDDQHNVVIVARGTREPLIALAYGEAI